MNPSEKFFPDSLAGDIRAGVLVSLLALPLSLGIALASGFPAVAGILTAIVAGLIASWFKGAPLTIKGPAAGLIAIIIASVNDLGAGDPILGYKRTLAVGVVAAGLQVIIAVAGGASLGTLVPKSVVHGMLAAIGVIIVSKQIHVFLGVTSQAKGALPLLADIPHSLGVLNPMILTLGVVTLLIVLSQGIWARGPFKWVPGPLLALAVVIPLGIYLGLHDDHGYDIFDHHYLSGHQFDVQVSHSLVSALTFPDFAGLLDPRAWKYVIMLALIGSIESTLTVLAVDKLSKTKKKADVNRDLLSIGVANLASSLVGGLPMISEVVRSRANLDSGAKSHWSNATMGFCLLIAVTLGHDLLELIPLSALAALLLITGARLASWKNVQEALHVGRDQALYFSTTLIVTLATDLLLGVFAGIAVKIVVHRLQGVSFSSLFGMSVVKDAPSADSQNTETIQLQGSLVFFKIPRIEKQIMRSLSSGRRVVLDLRQVELIDHTTMERLHELTQEHPKLSILGDEKLHGLSEHELATRLVH